MDLCYLSWGLDVNRSIKALLLEDFSIYENNPETIHILCAVLAKPPTTMLIEVCESETDNERSAPLNVWYRLLQKYNNKTLERLVMTQSKHTLPQLENLFKFLKQSNCLYFELQNSSLGLQNTREVAYVLSSNLPTTSVLLSNLNNNLTSETGAILASA